MLICKHGSAATALASTRVSNGKESFGVITVEGNSGKADDVQFARYTFRGFPWIQNAICPGKLQVVGLDIQRIVGIPDLMELLDHGSGDAIGFPQGDIAFVPDWIEDEGLIVNVELFWRLIRKLMLQPLAVQIHLLGRDFVRNAGSTRDA